MWVHLQHGQGPTCYLISARLPKIGIAIATARQFAKSDSVNPWSAENLSSLSMGGLVAGICLGQRLAWTLSERRWGGVLQSSYVVIVARAGAGAGAAAIVGVVVVVVLVAVVFGGGGVGIGVVVVVMVVVVVVAAAL